MIEVVVYIKEDYSQNKSLWVSSDTTKEEITKLVNDTFDEWYFFDII